MNEIDPAHIESIFADVADLPPEERSRAVANACGDDAELRAEIESLLKAYDSATFYFDDLRDFLPMQSVSEVLDDDQRFDPYGLVGKTVSHFRVEEHLGGGAMGVVYRARDVHLPRDIALKLLAPEMSRSEEAISRFKQEVIAASSLEHSNIAIVHEVGRLHDGQLFVAMTFYDGETLKKKIQRGPLPIESAVEYGVRIASGLADAHSHGIIHRDVKPANVMVTREGHVKLLDFGIAKVSDVSALTNTGAVVGTLAYMSPEQIRGEKVDARTDVWSLGLVLYEMLTGVHPFMGEHQQAILYQILNLDPPQVTFYRPDVPAELAELVGACLMKDPAARIQSAEEVGLRLAPPPPPPSPSTVKDLVAEWWKRSPATVAASLFALVIAILVAILVPSRPRQLDLAVLPFVNIGADSVLVDGLRYVVTSSLARLEGIEGELSVVPADAIVSEDVRNSQDAARKFNVGYVFSGSVQRLAAGISLNLDLVDAETSRISESRYFEFGDAELGRVQDDVVLALPDLLNLHLSSDVRARLTEGNTKVSGAYDRYTRARGYLMNREEERNVDAAINLLLAAVNEDSKFALAYAALGEAYLQKYTLTADVSFMEEAILYGVQARDLKADLLPVRNLLGLTYLERGDYKSAEVEFLRAYALEPMSAEVMYNLARVYYKLNQLLKAEQYFRDAIDLKPDYWVYQNALGKFYYYQDRYVDAADCFKRVVELRPENPWGYINLGAQFQALDRPEDAFHNYTLATSVNPDMPDAVAFAYNNIARLFYSQRDFETAAGFFEDAVAIEDLDYDSWDQLGNAYTRIGRDDGAHSAWNRTVELTLDRLSVNPNDREALNSITEVYAKLGQADSATATLYRLLSQERLESNDFVVAAKVHEILGRRDSALHYVEVALDNGATPESFELSIWLDELREDGRYRMLLGQADVTR